MTKSAHHRYRALNDGDQPLRVCLAGSGGGHVRQLLDLEPAWSRHDAFFVTEDTSLGRSLANKHRVTFVPHYAAGQARLGAPLRMLRSAFVNFFRSASIILRERPDVIISTGAGAVYFAVVWARLTGARVVIVESFARFDRPSLFGRLAAPLAHDLVVQSAALATAYPKAKVFDPLRMLDGPRPEKQPLLFSTVGATLPFDRLTKSVAELKRSGALAEEVLFQVGVGGVTPDVGTVKEEIPFGDVQAILKRADLVVCHGGTGSLITALREGCRVVAMPRQAALGEHYDDHQTEITDAFAARGLIQIANTVEDLDAAVRAAKQKPPVMATTAPDELIAHLNAIFSDIKSST